MFFAGLFPQFLDPTRPVVPQILVLGATYLVIDGTFLTAYGLGAERLAVRFRGAGRRYVDRLAGAGMLGTALLLGFRAVPNGHAA